MNEIIWRTYATHFHQALCFPLCLLLSGCGSGILSNVDDGFLNGGGGAPRAVFVPSVTYEARCQPLDPDPNDNSWEFQFRRNADNTYSAYYYERLPDGTPANDLVSVLTAGGIFTGITDTSSVRAYSFAIDTCLQFGCTQLHLSVEVDFSSQLPDGRFRGTYSLEGEYGPPIGCSAVRSPY